MENEKIAREEAVNLAKIALENEKLALENKKIRREEAVNEARSDFNVK